MKETENRELLWQLFRETGDPLCWILYRRDGSAPGEGRPRRP